jgi:tetratricopeptide (TPR) repeat protein
MKRIFVVITLGFFLACGTEKSKEINEAAKKEEQPPEVKQQIDLIKQYPDSIALREKTIDVLDSLGAGREALQQLDSLIRWDSLNAGYWTRKGEISEKYGDTIGALKAYRYSLQIYRSPDVLLKAANLFAEKKNDTALMITKSIKEEWRDRNILSHALFIEGIYYARKGMRGPANRSFDVCIGHNYQYLEAYMEKGFLLWDGGDTGGAKKIFTIVVQLKATYPDGYYWLAKCEERMSDSLNAALHYRQANLLDPQLTTPSWVREMDWK